MNEQPKIQVPRSLLGLQEENHLTQFPGNDELYIQKI